MAVTTERLSVVSLFSCASVVRTAWSTVRHPYLTLARQIQSVNIFIVRAWTLLALRKKHTVSVICTT